ncbi:site-specific integrase [Dysgonomonas sp. 521]|uniref:site-specific integrase n=1 Tax=Dysgonomonas sp. 521 TaxID=2302932 RepID=UPI0013D3F43D|nr:site-specific integrase [Dysgonomonas sp. 521]NDV97471.1 site-specific integrase [Dysgonomonas sp. 521]
MKSTFRTLFYLRKNQPRKDKTVPIMVKVTVNGESVQFNSKANVDPAIWDSKAGKVISRSKEAADINIALDNLRVAIRKSYDKQMEDYGYAMPEKIRNQVLGLEKGAKSLVEYIDLHNQQYENRVGVNTTRTTFIRYKLVKERVQDFLKQKYNVSDIPIRDLTPVVLENFYLYLRKDCKCENNSSMKTMQRLRKIVYFAKNMGEVMADPYQSFRVHFESVDREILTQEEIDTIYNKEFITGRLEQIRDVFIFACYTGLSYIDVSNLTEDNIQEAFDGNLWVMTKRSKTNVNANIRLLDIPKEILAKYKGSQKDGKCLPVVSNQKTNEYLKEIATICGIGKKLTFHVSRHTFGTTVTLANGVPIETVSKMLGHTDIRTTQIYARIVDKKLSSDMDNLAKTYNRKKRRIS